MSDYAPTLIAVDLVDDNPFQPRLAYDPERITAIAQSIRERGLLQPPIARPIAGGRYQVAFGHSRLRAFRELAADRPVFAQIPLIVRELDDETMALHAWTENKDRKDLTAYEEARAIERYTTRFGWSQKLAAARLGLDPSTVSNKLRLLRLPPAALEQLEAGTLSERQAMALMPLAELPPAALEQRLNNLYVTMAVGSGYVHHANELIRHAAQLDSGSLRRHVEQVLNALTIALEKQPWSKEICDDPKVHAALCKDCPIRLKGANRCPDKGCAQLKSTAAAKRQAAAAAAKTGLPAVAIGGYGNFDDLSGVTLTAIKAEAGRRGCGNLGVAHSPNRYFTHKVKDFPDCGIVCAHGDGKRCACKIALARSADPATSQKAKERHDKKQIKEVYKGPAERALAAALTEPSTGLWRLLLKAIAWSVEHKLPADATAATIHAAIAEALVKEAIKYEFEYNTPNVAGARTKLEQLLSAAGVTPPWSLATAAGSPAAQLADQVREHLATARQLAGDGLGDHPMAAYALAEARVLHARVIGEDLILAEELQTEIDGVAALLRAAAPAAPAEPGQATGDICAQTSGDQALDKIRQRLAPIEEAIADGAVAPGMLEDIEALRDALIDLADDPSVDDDAWEQLNQDLDYAEEQVAAMGVPQ